MLTNGQKATDHGVTSPHGDIYSRHPETPVYVKINVPREINF